MEKKIHQGKNIARFRQILGMKQDALASVMGNDWSQINVSRLEAKEEIEPAILDEVAKALKLPVEAIKNFDEGMAINNIACNFSDNASVNYRPTFNSMEKWIEALEEIKNLNAALIKEKDERIAFMERMLQHKM